jgi:hypothetical protein
MTLLKSYGLVLVTVALFDGVKRGIVAVNPDRREPAILFKDTSKPGQALQQRQEPAGNLSDPGVWVLTIRDQIFHANLDDLFPTQPWLRLNPSLNFYRLTACPRKDIATCMYYGDAGCWCLYGLLE